MTVIAMNKIISKTSQKIIQESLIWDNHGCLPLRTDTEFMPHLERYLNSGVSVVSLNIGFDLLPWEESIHIIAMFRDWISTRSDKYILIETTEDIQRAKKESKLGVVFDIEGGNVIDNDVNLLGLYYKLGVRWMLLAYNRNNRLGGGCLDDDSGLTKFGIQVVEKMAEIGMLVCCSHAGPITARDIIEKSPNPVIFSHANPLSLHKHPRNVSDQLISACASRGGVIGISGVGMYLGNVEISTLVDNIEYVADLTGIDHVGIGLDIMFDQDEVVEYVKSRPDLFELQGQPAESIAKTVQPECFPEIIDQLISRGYKSEDIAKILGQNWLRLASSIWQ